MTGSSSVHTMHALFLQWAIFFVKVIATTRGNEVEVCKDKDFLTSYDFLHVLRDHSESPSEGVQEVTQRFSWNETTHKELVFPEENIDEWVITSEHFYSNESLKRIQNDRERNRSAWGNDRFGYDILISDKIGPNRQLRDTRNSRCQNKTYPIHKLPAASIVICYHNEAVSVLVRMINSIIERTPEKLIEEILLLDDWSDRDLIVESYLRKYGRSRWPAKIKYSRSNERQGLMKCRVEGARMARGEALVFLDSHCEVNEMWLEPLLARLVEFPDGVVAPVVDVLYPEDFRYVPSLILRGGFHWDMEFRWLHFPRSYFNDPENYAKPTMSPALSGGLFAIRKAYFHHIGELDTGMDIWGAENVEFSIRVWTCGGRIEILPCSRVGHVFRNGHSYKDDTAASLKYNGFRTAIVWFDEYKEKFFEMSGYPEGVSCGRVKDRVELRRKLKCKSFQWYIDHVYPELKSQ